MNKTKQIERVNRAIALEKLKTQLLIYFGQRQDWVSNPKAEEKFVQVQKEFRNMPEIDTSFVEFWVELLEYLKDQELFSKLTKEYKVTADQVKKIGNPKEFLVIMFLMRITSTWNTNNIEDGFSLYFNQENLDNLVHQILNCEKV